MENKKIPLGEILYNLGYWTTLAIDYYKQMNVEFSKMQDNGAEVCENTND